MTVRKSGRIRGRRTSCSMGGTDPLADRAHLRHGAAAGAPHWRWPTSCWKQPRLAGEPVDAPLVALVRGRSFADGIRVERKDAT